MPRSVHASPRRNLDLDAPFCLGNVNRLDQSLVLDNVRYAPTAYLQAIQAHPDVVVVLDSEAAATLRR